MDKLLLESLDELIECLDMKHVKNDTILFEKKDIPNYLDGDKLDYTERQLLNSRKEYKSLVDKYNNSMSEISRLEIAAKESNDPKVIANLNNKKAELKQLKSQKSQKYWDKVEKNRNLKAVKLESANLYENRLPEDKSVDPEFGIPEEKKYPLYDKKHVISAIKLFGHVEPKYESQLAKAIIQRMEKYNISFDMVGEENPLFKHLPANKLNESFEYETRLKISRILNDIRTVQYGYADETGNPCEIDNAIVQTPEQFEQSNIGTELEVALYLERELGKGFFIISGIGGSEELRLAYFVKEGDQYRVVDPTLKDYNPRYINKESVLFIDMEHIIKEYKKHTLGSYQIFNSLDFLIGQPVSQVQQLLIQHWNEGILNTEAPEIVEDEMQEDEYENQEMDTQENMEQEMNEAENLAKPTTSTSTNLRNSNMDAQERSFDNKISQADDRIAKEKDKIADMENVKANMSDNYSASEDATTKEQLDAAIKNQANRIARSRSQVTKLEEDKRKIEKQKSNVLRQYENQANAAMQADKQAADEKEAAEANESAQFICEAMSICDLAFSGEAGKIAEYLISGKSTGSAEIDYIANKVAESAIIKNIVFKYNRELNKISPDRTILLNLKMKLRTEINKLKKQ